MIKTIRPWLIASLQPLAVIYAYRSRWPPMMEHPILAIMLAGLCTAAVLIAGFGRKVWEKRLEERAIQAAGDGILTLCHWVVAWGKNLAPGFRRRYNRQMKLEHEIFNVRGLGLVNNFTIELTDVFVDLKIHPSSRRPQTTADPLARSIPTGDATREAQTIGQIWDFLRARWKSRTQTPTAMVVVGAPGSGKTTLLQHVAVTLAA